MNQVWTHPAASQEAARAVLPEEFFHLITASLRPAQLYPLLNHFAGRPQLPDVDQFSDLVEAIYAASWPLLQNKPLLSRSLPSTMRENRELCKDILRLARNLACFHARPDRRATAQRGALWALTMFLHYIVPRVPGQAPTIVRLLARIQPPERWTSRLDLLQHLVREAVCVLSVSKQIQRSFYFTNADDVHLQTRNAILLTSVLLRAESSLLLPVFPALLGVVTVRTSTFVPVFRLRDSRRWVRASLELWDFTPHLRRFQRSLLKQPLTDHGVPRMGACPAASFFWNYIRVLVSFVSSTTRAFPPDRFVGALALMAEQLPGLSKGLLRGRRLTCPACRSMTDDNLVHAIASIGGLLPRRWTDLLEVAREYPSWLQTDGVKQIEDALHQFAGLDKPVRLEPPRDHLDRTTLFSHMRHFE